MIKGEINPNYIIYVQYKQGLAYNNVSTRVVVDGGGVGRVDQSGVFYD